MSIAQAVMPIVDKLVTICIGVAVIAAVYFVAAMTIRANVRNKPKRTLALALLHFACVMGIGLTAAVTFWPKT